MVIACTSSMEPASTITKPTGNTMRRRNIAGDLTSTSPTSLQSPSPLLERSNSRASSTDQIDANNDEWDDDTGLGPLVVGSHDQHLTLMDEIVLLGLKDRQGHLSFMNDCISYVLRGCILMELAFRKRVRILREPGSASRPLPDRYLEVLNASSTGEVLLDEALRLVKGERNTVAEWLDLLSGETWNPLKVGYQLKQVRERVAKGLVDKGILRTEKSSFIVFEMATHPLCNQAVKEDLIRRVVNICTGRGVTPTLREMALAGAALTGDVLGNALQVLPSKDRDTASTRAEELLRQNVSLTGPMSPIQEVVSAVLLVLSRLDSVLF